MSNFSLAPCSFASLAKRYPIWTVKTVTEIRREKLLELIDSHGNGSLAELNVKLGLARTDATLAQIKNQSVNSGSGKPRGMGDTLARRIEQTLGLPTGWMDNLFTYDDPRQGQRMEHLHKVAESMTPYQLDQLIKIGAALVEPERSNGTTDQ